MLCSLRLLFAGILIAMVGVTTWASLRQPIFAIPPEVFTNPWFIATLFDAYFGFLCFYLWIAYKESGIASRLLWFVAVMLLGNLAMALYALRELAGLRSTQELQQMLALRHPPRPWLPALLCLASVIVYLLGMP